MPQPRSITVSVPARHEPRGPVLGDPQPGGLLEPSGVKYIRSASSPNLSRASARSWAWVIAAATLRRLAPYAAAAVWVASESSPASTAAREQSLPVVGQQPAEGVEVHAAILSGRADVGLVWHSIGESASF